MLALQLQAAVARLRQGTGEPRSSSGECTSGESQSEKNAAAFHDGSPKQDSGSQEEDELPAIVATEKATPTEPVPPAKKEHEKAAAVAEEGEQPGEKAKAGGKGDRPKLPRPEGVCKCPRCGGEDTKFCYYNNYNIKQPRYFCKVTPPPPRENACHQLTCSYLLSPLCSPCYCTEFLLLLCV